MVVVGSVSHVRSIPFGVAWLDWAIIRISVVITKIPRVEKSILFKCLFFVYSLGGLVQARF